ncbi:MAG: hypothetical protein ACI4TH_00580, partial [Candidatus Ornithomonoglobus sp.]
MEYGHNEAGTDSYKANLEKYYTRAHEAGAKLLIVSAVERHNNWDEENENYTSGFGGYIEAGKAFVDEKIAAGATDIAFVDLNTEYITWMNQEIRRINGINSNISKKAAIEFYYRSVKNSMVDTTHINDAGADQGAIAFFKAAQKVYDAGKNAEAGSNAKIQADVLADILDGWHSERTAYQVSDEIIAAGSAPNSYWDTPVTNSVPYKYSIAVADAKAENGELKSVSLRVQNDLDSYSRAVINVTAADGTETKYYTKAVVDNTADTKGTLKTFTEFTKEEAKGADAVTVTVPEGAVCTVQAYKADLSDWTVDENTQYSIAYTVKSVTDTILTEDGADISEWTSQGSAGRTNTAVTEGDDAPYVNIQKSGKGSCMFRKSLDKSVSGGLVNIRLKLRYTSGLVSMSIAKSAANYFSGGIELLKLSGGRVTMNGTDIITSDDGSLPNAVNSGDWLDIDCIVDYDMGTVEVSAAGSEYAKADISSLQSNST